MSDPSPAKPFSFYIPVRPDWLALRAEEAIEPDLPIVDPHHHLWDRDRPGGGYLLGALLDDLGSGHRIVATVFIQCRAMYRAGGPAALRPLGEVEFANGIAAMSASGQYGATRVAAGIVGYADLTLGAAVEETLEAYRRYGGERLRGVRYSTSRDDDPVLAHPSYQPAPGLMGQATFREGFARLAKYGLSFDSWLYHPQIDELADLARAFPETPIVLDHAGGPLGAGRYAGRRAEVFADWSAAMRRLAACPNAHVKLGGLAQAVNGFGFETAALPPDSATLAAAWQPYVAHCLDSFGAARCMFESNFPVDKGSYSYGIFWNACKRLVAGASESEKAAVFHGTAAKFYRLDPPAECAAA